MLRTGQLHRTPPRPRDLARRRECCYRGPWRLPGPDFHRLAAMSLSLGYVVVLLLSVVLGARATGRTFLRNRLWWVLAAGRPGSGRPRGGGVDAGPRRPGQGQGPPQAVPQGRHAPLTRPDGGVGSVGWPRQRPVRGRVQGPGRGVGTAGEAVQRARAASSASLRAWMRRR